jgi:hypothetical protein
VTDTIFVEASDPVGITTLGYEIRSLTGALMVADSVQSDGSFSTLVRTFTTRIPVTSFPTPVIVQAFARNCQRSCATWRASPRARAPRYRAGGERLHASAA